jgi:hypothetical protein
MKAERTPASFGRIRRWEHEDSLDDTRHGLDRNPNALKIRRSTVEPVFGTLKYPMGSTHFLMKTSTSSGVLTRPRSPPAVF